MNAEERRAWLNSRRIGGSTAAMILGVSDYGGPAKAYDEVVAALEGRSEPGEETDDQRRGNVMEPVILDLYREQTRRSVFRKKQQAALPGRDYMTANIDGHIVGSTVKEHDGPGVFEAKAPRATKFSRIKLTGKMPREWVPQIMHSMYVLSWKWGAYGIGDSQTMTLMHFDVEIDIEWCEDILVPAVDRFWLDHVVPRNRPDDVKPDAVELPDLDQQTELITNESPEWADAIAELREATYAEGFIGEIKALRQARVKALIGDDTVVEGAGVRAYYRHQKGSKTLDKDKVMSFLAEQGEDPEDYLKQNKPSRPFRCYDVELGKQLSELGKAEAKRQIGS